MLQRDMPDGASKIDTDVVPIVTWSNVRWSNEDGFETGEARALARLAEDLGGFTVDGRGRGGIVADLFDKRRNYPALGSEFKGSSRLSKYVIDGRIQARLEGLVDHTRTLRMGKRTHFVLLAPYSDITPGAWHALAKFGLGARRVYDCWYGHGTVGFILWNDENGVARGAVAAYDRLSAGST